MIYCNNIWFWSARYCKHRSPRIIGSAISVFSSIRANMPRYKRIIIKYTFFLTNIIIYGSWLLTRQRAKEECRYTFRNETIKIKSQLKFALFCDSNLLISGIKETIFPSRFTQKGAIVRARGIHERKIHEPGAASRRVTGGVVESRGLATTGCNWGEVASEGAFAEGIYTPVGGSSADPKYWNVR